MKNEVIKEMTPMKKYSAIIDEFKKHIKIVDKNINVFSLNKSNPKSIPYSFDHDNRGYTKGVESDFILIFKNKDDVSLGIVFNYIKLKPEEQTVSVTIKNATADGGIKSSFPMSIVDFKNKLKEFNKYFTLEDNFITTLERFAIHFDIDNLNVGQEMKKRNSSIIEFLETEKEKFKINDMEEEYNKSVLELDKAKAKALKLINNLPEMKEKQNLLNRLKDLDIAIQKETIEINKTLQIKEKTSKLNKAKDDLQSKNYKITNNLEKKLSEFPAELRKTLLKTHRP